MPRARAQRAAGAYHAAPCTLPPRIPTARLQRTDEKLGKPTWAFCWCFWWHMENKTYGMTTTDATEPLERLWWAWQINESGGGLL